MKMRLQHWKSDCDTGKHSWKCDCGTRKQYRQRDCDTGEHLNTTEMHLQLRHRKKAFKGRDATAIATLRRYFTRYKVQGTVKGTTYRVQQSTKYTIPLLQMVDLFFSETITSERADDASSGRQLHAT